MEDDEDEEQSGALRRKGSQLLGDVASAMGQYKVRCGELEVQCEQMEKRNQYLEAKLNEEARRGQDEADDGFLSGVQRSGVQRSGVQASFENIQWKMVAMDAQAKAEEMETALASEMLRRAQAEDDKAAVVVQRDKLDHELRQIVEEIGTMREIFISMGLQQQQQ